MIVALPAQPPTGLDRNGWIDCARGAAALAVALFHFSRVMPPPSVRLWPALVDHGYLGVPVFFVLSGYCITASWLKVSGAREFVARRLRRIMPAYWASLVLVGLLAVAARLLRGVNDIAAFPTSAAGLAATVLLWTAPATSVPTVNWVYWSLTFEMAFYIVVAALLLGPGSVARPWRLVVAHGCLTALSFFAVSANRALFFVPLWPLFGLGVMLALRRRHPGPAGVMLVISVLHIVFTALGPEAAHSWMIVAVVTTLLLGAFGRLRLPGALRPLAWVGRSSYSLYLIHVPFGMHLLVRHWAPAHPGPALYFLTQAVWLALVLAATWLFWWCFERPFTRDPSAARPIASPGLPESPLRLPAS